ASAPRSTRRRRKRKNRRLPRHSMRSRGSTPIRRASVRSGFAKAAPWWTRTSVPKAGERTRPTRRPMPEITYLDAIREAHFEEMERDENVFCIGEDIGAYGGAFKVIEGLMAKFGEQRVVDFPISEIGIVGAAAGAAHMGMRPIVEMQFIDFIGNAYDMLTNYVATARYRAFLSCSMVVWGLSGGYVCGGPFHSQN